MKIFIIILVVLLIVAVLAFNILTIVAAAIYGSLFGSRQDKNPKLKYFSPEDYDLEYEEIESKTQKSVLRGIVCGEGTTTVVFCHGMGPGCAAYTTEIAKLVSFGYRVVAVDYMGCGISDGKEPRAVRAGVDAVELAADYAKERFGGKVVLVGHSWGAYSALCAAESIKVDGVVAMSAPNSFAKLMSDGAAALIGGWVKILKPFLWIVSFCRGGSKNNLKAAKCIDESGVPALIIHGEKDNVVPLGISAYADSKGTNVKKLLVSNRAHNPYLTENAQNKLNELTVNLQKASGKTPDAAAENYLASANYAEICEEDEEVMQQIKTFIDGV